MSIEKASILAFVNSNLQRSETDIDIQILTVINDLSLYRNFLEDTDESKILANGGTYLEKPTGFKAPISIVLNDGSVNLAPLKPMPGGYKGYREAMDNFNSGMESTPKYYACFGNYIYVWPTAGQAYTSIIDFYKQHALVANPIEFGDEFTNCMNFGAAYYVAMANKLTTNIAIWQPAYFDQIKRMVASHPGHARHVGG